MDVVAEGLQSIDNRQGTLPGQELAWLLAEMRRGTPWRDALGRLDLPILSGKRHWFTDGAKARYYLGLPVAARRRALDVGAGSGVIAQGLADGFEQVVALEHEVGWCDFMRERYAQDGVKTITVMHGSAVPRLPFPDAEFDLVVVNGVLEWIPEAAPSLQPRESQLAFLREVRRVLRPNGVVGIAIENRLFLRHFMGQSPHGEAPFVVLMPRWLADWYTNRQRGTAYRTWIYSYRGYHRLLRDAGFGDLLVQQSLPTYHTPAQVVDVRDSRAARGAFGTPGGIGSALLGALTATGLLGYLTHSFYIRART